MWSVIALTVSLFKAYFNFSYHTSFIKAEIVLCTYMNIKCVVLLDVCIFAQLLDLIY